MTVPNATPVDWEFAKPAPDPLMVALRGGGDEAFADVFQRHGPLVHGVCTRVLGAAGGADDATLAVFIILSRRVASLPDDCELVGWCHRTALNCARTLLRARTVTPREGTPASPGEVLDAALCDLSEALRLPLIMLHLEGLEREDIIRTLGMADTALRHRLADGLEALRLALARRLVPVPLQDLVRLLTEAAALQAALPAELLAQLQRLRRMPLQALPPAVLQALTRPPSAMQSPLARVIGGIVLVVGLVLLAVHLRSLQQERLAVIAQAPPLATIAPTGTAIPAGPPVMMGITQLRQPDGGRVLLWSRSRWRNYCLATFDFTRGLRGDHPDVRNEVQLIFGNNVDSVNNTSNNNNIVTNNNALVQSPRAVESYPGSVGKPSCALETATMPGFDQFQVGLLAGESCTIRDLGHLPLSALSRAPSMTGAGTHAVVVLGDTYAIAIQDGDQPARVVAMTVDAYQNHDAVALTWKPLATR